MLRRQPDAASVVREREEQEDIAQHAEKTPTNNQPKLELLKQMIVKGQVCGADLLVAISEQDGADEVDDKLGDGKDTEGPRQSEVLYHDLGRQTVDKTCEVPLTRNPWQYPRRKRQTSNTATASRDTIGHAPPLREPLWDDANRADELEAHAPTEADPLA